MILNDGYPRYLDKHSSPEMLSSTLTVVHCKERKDGEKVFLKDYPLSQCAVRFTIKSLVLRVECFKDFYYNTNFFL